MSFSVNKLAPELVAPAEPTPSGRLPLSFMDRNVTVRLIIDLILVFEQGVQPAKAIRAALSRVLVPYYPVAGRIVEPIPGEAEVDCTGNGVWFVEASVDCSLEDVNNLERPLLLPRKDLIPYAPPDVIEGDLTFMLQVTEFRCGGFAVGIRFNHAVFDGVGAAQFLKAVADVARGHARPVVEPVWCRETIPSPPKMSQRHAASSPAAFHFQTSVFDISSDRINAAKNQFLRETGQKCSTFDVVTAMLWQCRTRAISLDPHADLDLGFAANTRHLLRGLLPEVGFYGNCVYPMGIKANAGTIAASSLVEVILLIRDAKDSLSAKFSECMMGGSAENPYTVPPGYGTMAVSDWSRVGFSEVNYGWGEPIQVVPLTDDNNLVASCIYLSPPKPKQGVRLMTRCVEMEHLPAFSEELMKFAEDLA
ncbi:myricetin 3-O-glucosyl 1,2-rhamnoside 6'-O-caffeoyltransferase AT1-like [Musa acuminata AAA Group]|uniref:myricetin 3-O-glucosyl 1,2-rhamnoside 6'-O-caffeoyltransferase AT1-like n=1 Tax=Musa acuminata AAA Group TaxID=214697 RepID=UPI0031E2850B